MIETSFGFKSVVLCGYHKGFIRLAVKHKLPLVPVFTFGENNIMDNVHAPKMQRYFLQRFGVAFPVAAFGRWNFPLPCPAKLTAVVGKPVEPFEICGDLLKDENDTASFERGIDLVNKAYFDALVAMVERHKKDAGYPDLTIDVMYSKR